IVWALSSLNVIVQVGLLLDFPFAELESLQMKDFCSHFALFLGPMSDIYEKAFTCSLFVSASLAVTSSYIGVMVAARSASTNKTSFQKARNTLLLHLVQLALTLSSTLYTLMLKALSRMTTRLIVVRVQSVLYLFVIIFPRCLSALIYGMRDKNIRPVLMQNLCCCCLTLLAVPADKQSFS
ncbi:odorant receptor 131-2-like, partial [Nelusetta ayraudi]|uniref:odorant receptor 131-2-like n=1 Tax=Nelusetta ayraudi TaxID=303726 RepID=UPI003F72615A